MDHSAGSWIVDIEGVGHERTVIGVVWNSDDTKRSYFFNTDEFVVLNQNIRVGRCVIPSGTMGCIITMRDPTLTPKHHAFMEVCFSGATHSVWVGVEQVVSSSFERDDLVGSEDREDEVDAEQEGAPPQTIH